MKKLILILLLTILFPINVYALTGTITVTCNRPDIALSDSTTCTITGHSDDYVSAVKVKPLPDDIKVVVSNITKNSIWQGTITGRTADLSTDNYVIGDFPILTYTVTGIAVGKGYTDNVAYFYDVDGNRVYVQNIIYYIDVSESTVDPTGVSLQYSNLDLLVGSKQSFTAKVMPTNATNKKVTWSSSDSSVVTIDSNGTATAISKGKAVITATTANGLKANCTINVLVAVSSVTISPKSVSLKVGERKTVTVTVAPSDASDKSIYWISNNERVAVVHQNGEIIALSEGTATITAVGAQSRRDSIEVTVSNSTKPQQQLPQTQQQTQQPPQTQQQTQQQVEQPKVDTPKEETVKQEETIVDEDPIMDDEEIIIDITDTTTIGSIEKENNKKEIPLVLKVEILVCSFITLFFTTLIINIKRKREI